MTILLYVIVVVAVASILFFLTEQELDDNSEIFEVFSLSAESPPDELSAQVQSSHHTPSTDAPSEQPRLRALAPSSRPQPMITASAAALGEKGVAFASTLRALRTERNDEAGVWNDEPDRVSVRFEQLEDELEKRICAIDLEEIKNGDRAVRLPCLHEFHADCMLPYLGQQNAPCCPIDRCAIRKEDLPLLPVWTVVT
eukprot:IDg14172t1